MIVWDEAPTIPKAAIDAVDKCLRDVTGRDDLPFGGKLILLGGDWRQMPPVLPRVEIDAICQYTLRATSWWGGPHFREFHLHTNMRAQHDPSYANFLLDVGNGDAATVKTAPDETEFHPHVIELPPAICAPPEWTPHVFLDWVFDGHTKVAVQNLARFYSDRAVVVPTNENAKELNDIMLDNLPAGGERISRSVDSAIGDAGESDHCPPEFLHGLNSGGLPPHELRIREGMLCIWLRNYAPQKGLCNSTRLVVRGMYKYLLRVEIVTGPFKNEQVLIPRICCESSGDNELPFTLRRFQFPVKPAWAMTINKSQGQTLGGRLGIYLPGPVFAHVQLYVALSRGTTSRNIRVLANRHVNKQAVFVAGHRAKVFLLNLVSPLLLGSRKRSSASTMASSLHSAQELDLPLTTSHCTDAQVSCKSTSALQAFLSAQPLQATEVEHECTWEAVSDHPTDAALEDSVVEPHSLEWPNAMAYYDEWAASERQGLRCMDSAHTNERLPDEADSEYSSEDDWVPDYSSSTLPTASTAD